MVFYGILWDLMGFIRIYDGIPSGKRLRVANWKITMLLMGKSTISMAMFNSYVSLPEGNGSYLWFLQIHDNGIKIH